MTKTDIQDLIDITDIKRLIDKKGVTNVALFVKTKVM